MANRLAEKSFSENLREFIFKKDDSSIIKYKNLCYLAVSSIIILAFAFVMMWPAPKDEMVTSAAPQADFDYAEANENDIAQNIQDQQALLIHSNSNTDNSNNGYQDILNDPNEPVANAQVAPSPFDSVRQQNQELQVAQPTVSNDYQSNTLETATIEDNPEPVVSPTPVQAPVVQQPKMQQAVVQPKPVQREPVKIAEPKTASKPAQEASQKTKPAETAKPVETQYDLYCGNYISQNQATEAKAKIAFATGQHSNVVKRTGSYRVHLGPFKTRDAAVAEFKRLDNAALTSQCALVTK